MSATQSDLAPTGFDYVVAVTQDSVNARLAEYLYGNLGEAVLCYVYDDDNNPVQTDYAKFVANAGNTDPFTVPNGTPASDPRVQNLNNAAFAFAVKAKLGLPPGVPPASLPPVIALKPGQSDVTYTMLFAEFVATALSFGPRGSVTWFNESQPYGTAWTFSGLVDLNFADASFGSLSNDAQTRLKDIGDQNMFGVQQLYYDLNNSGLEKSFAFDKLPTNNPINGFMVDDFIGTYWAALKGNEVLGFGVRQVTPTQPSAIAVTDLNFFAPDAVVAGAPLTLNYLCATNNDALPAVQNARFGWDWIDAAEADQHDGVAALNRNALARYLNSADPGNGALSTYVARNCYQPSVTVTYKGGIQVEVDYQWGMTAGQAPTVTFPTSGNTLVTYSYSSGTASDQAGLNGDAGKMELSSSFDLSVAVQGNQLVVTQHLVVWTYVRYLATDDSGNVVDKQITDTYTIGVDDTGHIKATLASSVPVDNSKTPQANGFLNFWADVQSLSDSVTQWAQSCVATRLADVPLSFVENFVFPGGATFAFTDAGFSAAQDLVAHIAYTD